MTDDDKLSRRQSLKGIATTGAIIGGLGLGAGSASAFKSGSHLDFMYYDPYKKKAKFRVFNNHRKTKKYKYKVSQSSEDGTLTVESDGATEYGYFWVKAPKGKETIKLYEKTKKGTYDYVNSATVDSSEKNDHDGKDDKKHDGKDDKKYDGKK